MHVYASKSTTRTHGLCVECITIGTYHLKECATHMSQRPERLTRRVGDRSTLLVGRESILPQLLSFHLFIDSISCSDPHDAFNFAPGPNYVQ